MTIYPVVKGAPAVPIPPAAPEKLNNPAAKEPTYPRIACAKCPITQYAKRSKRYH
jgi:hypothetical protein